VQDHRRWDRPLIVLAVEFHDELVARERRLPLLGAMLVDARELLVEDLIADRPQLGVGARRLRCLGRRLRYLHRAALAIVGRAVLLPDLVRLVGHLGVLVAHQGMDAGMRFLAGLLIAAGFGLAIGIGPVAGVLFGPAGAGFGFAFEFLADGLPGVADDAHLDGLGDEGFEVLGHGCYSERCIIVYITTLCHSFNK